MYPNNGVGPALPARAEEVKADLLVMGRGRSRMRERIVGDATCQFLDHHAFAMLIAH
jgi:nucleotide-binding universal stress UspA family protein